MDIHTLSYFKQVAQMQHVTRAAEALHIAQPSLSRTIAALEAELGVQLLDRVGKNVSLNVYGEIVLRHTNRILQELDSMEKELEDAKGNIKQTVTLSMYAASKLLPGLITAFKKEYPNIIIHIVQDDLTAKQHESPDMAIFSSIHPANRETETILIEEEILLALPGTNPLAQRESLSLRDVADEEFICLQKGKSLRTITDKYCTLAGFEPKVILESDSPETVRELIRAGIGISFIPSVTWKGTQTKNVVLVPISFPQCKRYINLYWRDGYLSPAAWLFRDFVIDYFKKLR